MNFVLDSSLWRNIDDSNNPCPYRDYREFFILLLATQINHNNLFITPDIVDELNVKFQRQNIDREYYLEFKSKIRIKNADIYQPIPAIVYSDLTKNYLLKCKKAVDFIEKRLLSFERTPPYISKTKDRLKEVLRRNVLDSSADLSCILLAKQLNGILVTEDSGMSYFAEKVGVEVINLVKFFTKMNG